jgi:hypothetical protein
MQEVKVISSYNHLQGILLRSDTTAVFRTLLNDVFDRGLLQRRAEVF